MKKKTWALIIIGLLSVFTLSYGVAAAAPDKRPQMIQGMDQKQMQEMMQSPDMQEHCQDVSTEHSASATWQSASADDAAEHDVHHRSSVGRWQ